jgi:hypothetical protein
VISPYPEDSVWFRHEQHSSRLPATDKNLTNANGMFATDSQRIHRPCVLYSVGLRSECPIVKHKENQQCDRSNLFEPLFCCR